MLTRDQEISLAKEDRDHSQAVPPPLLGSAYALRATVDTLKEVAAGELPFDRTIKVSLTERLTKEQIQARMPHNLRTLDALIERSDRLFRDLIKRSTPESRKERDSHSAQALRGKSLQLVEELSLRTRRVTPLLKQLEAYADRMRDSRPLGRARRR
ncbi:MAG: hypothetical protein R3B96_13525 [Pirellulaceae bacterium]